MKCFSSFYLFVHLEAVHLEAFHLFAHCHGFEGDAVDKVK